MDVVGLRQERTSGGVLGVNLSMVRLIGVGDGAGAGNLSHKVALTVVGHDNLDNRLVRGLGPAVAVFSGLLGLVVVRALLCEGEGAKVDNRRGLGLALGVRDGAAQRSRAVGDIALRIALGEREVELLIGRRSALDIEVLGQECGTLGGGVDGHIVRTVVVRDAAAGNSGSELAGTVVANGHRNSSLGVRRGPAIARRGFGHLVVVSASCIKGDAAKIDGLFARLVRVVGDARGRIRRRRGAILRLNGEVEGVATVVVARINALAEEPVRAGVHLHGVGLVLVGDGRVVTLDLGNRKLAVPALGDLHRDDVIAVVVLPALGVRSRGLLHVELVGAFGEELDVGEGDRLALAILDVGDSLCAIRNLHAVGIVACSGDLDVCALVPVIAGDRLRCSEVLWCRRIIGVGECDMVGLVGL